MRNKDIILDFTSLLDVIMILLFFFVMFSSLETSEAQEKAKNAEATAIVASEEADKKMLEAERIKKQATDELKILREENNNSANHVEGIKEFGKSENIYFFLITEEKEFFSLVICRGNEEIGRIKELIPNKEQNRNIIFMREIEEKVGGQINDVLEENNYSSDKTILCNLIFNSGFDGTNTAYIISEKSIENYVKRNFPNLYISFIDEGRIEK